MTTATTVGSGIDVRMEGVRHRFGDFWALRGVSLSAEPGEFLTLLGPSGSGKTTLLRIVGGLLQPTKGTVYVGGRDVTRLPPQKRNMGFVFQNYALFPHLTLFENVAFALKLRKAPRAEIRRKVHETLDLVELTGLDRRYPAQLSGGQQQRVALARAIVFQPSVLLMDEPLGSLDKRLRQQLEIELRRLQREVGITTIYVTHDQEEAFSMSDRIAVMHEGEVRQFDRPAEIYRSPGDSFVANFVGDLNRFEGELIRADGATGVLRCPEGLDISVSMNGVAPGTKALICGVRPERLKVGRQVEADNCYSGTVRVLTFQGSYHRAEVNLPSGKRLLAEIHGESAGIREGDEVRVGWDIGDALVFGGGS